MEENNNKKGLIIGIIIILVIVLGFSGFFAYKMILNKKEIQKETEEKKEEVFLYTLKVYKQDNNFGYCLVQSDYCKQEGFTIPTKTEDTEVLAFDNNYKFFLFKDGEQVKVYNRETSKSEVIEFDYGYKEYQIYSNEDNNKIIGIVYKTSDDKIGYFNVNTKEKLYEDNYLSTYGLDKGYLLNSNKEEEKIVSEYGNGFYSFGKSKYFFSLNACGGDCTTKKIYSNNLKEIYDKDIWEQNISFKDNILYINENNKVKTIDIDGNIKDLKSYKEIKGLIENNVVFVESNKLKYENLENNIVKEVCNWNSNYFYDFYTSGYYTREKLDNMGENEKQEGMYIVINYSTKDKNGDYGIEYCYKSNGEVVEYPIKQEIGGRAKPVLYLYPTETTNVKVEFEHPEYLTTTYPKYNKSWEVKAYSNGDLYDKDNKYYYGLYWDEVRYNEVKFKEGFYVENDNAIEFLEEKLKFIGLNDRERNEFIMYWLPILENNGKSIVYFELTKERELGNKLIITPKPDSMLRVSIHIKKVNNKVNIKEQKLEKFKRFGFSAIEWGGMTY